jgi:hypothetical protein
MRKVLATLLLTCSLMGLTTAAQATTEHCPAGGTKVEANGGTQDDINGLVLAAGTQVCVKGSTDATGIITADGTSTLFELLGNGHDVSYYVVYESTPTETPPPTTVPPTTPPPTTVPPTTAPPKTHTHTPTWTPTWTPTNGATPGEHRLAETGFDRGDALSLAVGLGLLGSILVGTSYLRRRSS